MTAKIFMEELYFFGRGCDSHNITVVVWSSSFDITQTSKNLNQGIFLIWDVNLIDSLPGSNYLGLLHELGKTRSWYQ